MQMRLTELAELLGGTLTEPDEGSRWVAEVRPLEVAGPDDLAFYWDPAFAREAARCRAGCIVSREPLAGRLSLLVDDPQRAMLELLGHLYAERNPAPLPGVHPTAVVDPTAQLGEGVSVGPLAVVEAEARVGAGTQIRAQAFVGRGTVLGADCIVHPGAILLDRVTLGDRVVVWSAAVIGKDGFGFFPASGDRRDLSAGHLRVPQIGSVVLGDDVEVGSLTTVDRGSLEDTIVEDGVIVDSQVHVGHNCRVGRNSVLVGRTALGGSVEVGSEAYLLQGCGVGQGRKIGERAIVGSATGVMYRDVPDEAHVEGWPARPALRERRLQVILERLIDEYPGLSARLEDLERQLDRQHLRSEGNPTPPRDEPPASGA